VYMSVHGEPVEPRTDTMGISTASSDILQVDCRLGWPCGKGRRSRSFFLRQQTFLGSFMGTKSELLGMMPYFRNGQLRPVVDRVYPLSEVQAAVRQLASRDHFGKIVVIP